MHIYAHWVGRAKDLLFNLAVLLTPAAASDRPSSQAEQEGSGEGRPATARRPTSGTYLRNFGGALTYGGEWP